MSDSLSKEVQALVDEQLALVAHGQEEAAAEIWSCMQCIGDLTGATARKRQNKQPKLLHEQSGKVFASRANSWLAGKMPAG